MYTLTKRLKLKTRKKLRGLMNRICKIEYPKYSDVKGPNLETIKFFETTKSRIVAEVGIYEGATSLLLARHMSGDGVLHLFDFEERVVAVQKRLLELGYSNIIGHGNTHKSMDSYNWSLMRVLETHPEPLYDYVYIDGAHTWGIDALAFCLIDRLLKVGGYVDFDDYHWSLARSGTQNPTILPTTKRMYTPEQIETPHVALIVDLLVKRDARYVEVVKEKIFQKVRA
jgi:predicted O-methyltransferase YrrM